MCRAFLIAGIGSGCGKTTITAAVIQGLVDRGYKVQPFKVGPDYIDPQHHSKLAARPCRNLDCWMMGEEGVKRNFRLGCSDADVAVVEGVGGVYDGLGTGEFASTAYVAKLLDLPVILVVDAWGISRTAAALVKGIEEFDSLNIAGVIFNFVGSEGHYSLLKKVMEENLPHVPVLGGVIRSKKGFVPERHLGILQADELNWEERVQVLRKIAQQIDIEGILKVSSAVDAENVESEVLNVFPVKVAVARDKAFSFLYTENREVLERLCQEVFYFSPLEGETIPADAKALFLPGGYPELWEEQLLSNESFLADVRNFAASSRPIYAECGGLIFLSMAGVLPVEVYFGTRPLLGYAVGKATNSHPFLKKGAEVKGHVFHYSKAEAKGSVEYGYELFLPSKGVSLKEGFVKDKVLATYLHTNWFTASGRSLLEAFLGTAY